MKKILTTGILALSMLTFSNLSATSFNWDNSPLNWNNSSFNWNNWDNSPLNWNNSSFNYNRNNGIYDNSGNSLGYLMEIFSITLVIVGN